MNFFKVSPLSIFPSFLVLACSFSNSNSGLLSDSPESIEILGPNNQKQKIFACGSSEGEGDTWNCNSLSGEEHSCQKKQCDAKYCEYEATNICFISKSASGTSNAENSSNSLPSTAADWSFFFISDIHGGREISAQTAVRDSMNALAAQDASFDLIVNGGDITSHGIKDSSFNDYVANIYQNPGQADRLMNMPMHAVLGNHDYCGSVNPSTFFSDNGNWVMKDLVWTYETKKAGKSIGFIHVDTNILAYYPNLPDWLIRDCGPMKGYFDEFASRTAYSGGLVQYIKDKTVDAFKRLSQHDYVIVVGHHPVGGGACGGENDTSWLRDQIMQYKASAYLSGHVHAMDFGSDENTLYMTMGTSGTTGGRGCLNTQGWKNGKWESSESGFGAIRMYQDTLYMTYYDKGGRELLTRSINSRK